MGNTLAKRTTDEETNNGPHISTKRPVTFHLNSLNTKKKATTYDVVNRWLGTDRVKLQKTTNYHKNE
jgi:hypothetical protein